MEKKLTPKDKELYKRTDEVLHYIWDPIGVAGCPNARDEYFGYLANIFEMLMQKETTESIVNYLLSLEKENMGLSPNKENAAYVVEILQEYKEKIDEDYP